MYGLDPGSTRHGRFEMVGRTHRYAKTDLSGEAIYASAMVTSTDVVPSAAGTISVAGIATLPFGASSSTLSALDGTVGLDPAVPFAPGPPSLFALRMTCHLSTSALARERKWNSSSRGILSDGCMCIWRITLPIFEYCRLSTRVNALTWQETYREVMNVHFIVLLDSSKQVVACRHFLRIPLVVRMTTKKGKADLRLRTCPLIVQECLLEFVSPVPNPDCFGIGRQS